MIKDNFIYDIEKMIDLLDILILDKNNINYDNFIKSYNYITKDEINNTILEINPSTLAELYRQAENYYIEELNGRETGLAVTSEQVKDTICKYVYESNILSKSEQIEFEDYLYNSAC